MQELCDLFDHARSSYYYQSKDKPITDSTKSIIKSMKQISIETGQINGDGTLLSKNNLLFSIFFLTKFKVQIYTIYQKTK